MCVCVCVMCACMLPASHLHQADYVCTEAGRDGGGSAGQGKQAGAAQQGQQRPAGDQQHSAQVRQYSPLPCITLIYCLFRSLYITASV